RERAAVVDGNPAAGAAGGPAGLTSRPETTKTSRPHLAVPGVLQKGTLTVPNVQNRPIYGVACDVLVACATGRATKGAATTTSQAAGHHNVASDRQISGVARRRLLSSRERARRASEARA